MSAIFTHDDGQLRQAQAAAARVAAQRGQDTATLIEPLHTFYLAEAYHQKYRLRSHKRIVGELLEVYPDLAGFLHSTVVTRLNGYLAGYGTKAAFTAELPKFGLSAEAQRRAEGVAGELR